MLVTRLTDSGPFFSGITVEQRYGLPVNRAGVAGRVAEQGLQITALNYRLASVH